MVIITKAILLNLIHNRVHYVAEQVITNADAGSLDAQVAGRAPKPNEITHDRENEILNMEPNDPCDEIE